MDTKRFFINLFFNVAFKKSPPSLKIKISSENDSLCKSPIRTLTNVSFVHLQILIINETIAFIVKSIMRAVP